MPVGRVVRWVTDDAGRPWAVVEPLPPPLTRARAPRRAPLPPPRAIVASRAQSDADALREAMATVRARRARQRRRGEMVAQGGAAGDAAGSRCG